MQTLVPVASMIPWAASKPAPSSSPSSSVPDDPPRSRRLQVLQWCRRNGCPWDEATTYEASAEDEKDVDEKNLFVHGVFFYLFERLVAGINKRVSMRSYHACGQHNQNRRFCSVVFAGTRTASECHTSKFFLCSLTFIPPNA